MGKLYEKVYKQYAKYAHHRNLKEGQKWWNALHDVSQEKCREITTTQLDTFYSDKKIGMFLEWLKEQ